MKNVILDREPVELFRILKFEGLVASGGEAKHAIDSGAVTVNGMVETRKRRKIHGGDIVVYARCEMLMVYENPHPA